MASPYVHSKDLSDFFVFVFGALNQDLSPLSQHKSLYLRTWAPIKNYLPYYGRNVKPYKKDKIW